MEAATNAASQPSAESMVQEMALSMESCAAAGDWDRVEEIAISLRHAVMLVPEGVRRESMLTAQRSLEHVHSIAHDAKSDVTDKLSVLRRGRDATRAYTTAD